MNHNVPQLVMNHTQAQNRSPCAIEEKKNCSTKDLNYKSEPKIDSHKLQQRQYRCTSLIIYPMPSAWIKNLLVLCPMHKKKTYFNKYEHSSFKDAFL